MAPILDLDVPLPSRNLNVPPEYAPQKLHKVAPTQTMSAPFGRQTINPYLPIPVSFSGDRSQGF